MIMEAIIAKPVNYNKPRVLMYVSTYIALIL